MDLEHHLRQGRGNTLMILVSRQRYMVMATLLIGIGLLTRWPFLGLPHTAAKYSGSLIWGGMIYCAVATILPTVAPLRIGIIAGCLATGVEFSQLWHTEALDAFRRTAIGVLLIGRFFSWWDILSYWIGIAAVGLFDSFVSRPAATER
jgi:hypothetical protein